jgi:hypothetical protein
LRLSRRATTIGSGPSADLSLPGDEFVSGQHAEITFEQGTATLRNLSTNGTLVNGRPATETALVADDKIAVGLLYVLAVKRATRASSSARVSLPVADTAAATPGGGFKMPTWLMLYLAAMGVLFVVFAILSSRSETQVGLEEVQAQERTYATSRKLAPAETDRVLQLLATATVYERRGDMRSAYEAYREVLSTRKPIDPRAPAYLFAAARTAAIGLR